MWCKPMGGDGGEEGSTPHWQIAYKSKSKKKLGGEKERNEYKKQKSNFDRNSRDYVGFPFCSDDSKCESCYLELQDR